MVRERNWKIIGALVAVSPLVVASVGCSDDTSESASTAPTTAPAVEATEPTSSADAAEAAEAEVATALERSDVPFVDLAGISAPPPPRDASKPAIAVIDMSVPVYERPDTSAKTLGWLRAGAVVETSEDTTAPQNGCSGGFRHIRPGGFVCLGKEVTTDLDHPIVRAVTRGPDLTEKLPYMYGVVTRGGPAYARVPTEEQLETYEPNLDAHIDKWKKDEESGATYGLDVWLKWNPDGAPPALDAYRDGVTDERIPAYLADGGVVPNLSGLVTGPDAVKIDQVDRRQGVAFIDSFLVRGRRYNVSTDLRVIPADRFRPIRGSDFHGWRIGVDFHLPVAIVRRPGGKRWIWSSSKNRMVDGGELEWRSAWELTGKQKFYKQRLHYETKEGFWIDDRHGGRVDPAKRMPKWGQNGEKWIDVNLTKQVLVAYEGETPVYVTLISSGEDGLGDPDESKSTIRGIFRIHTKHVTTTMDSDAVGEEFELRDVPYVQYFKEGFALHGAYWHDGFGRPKSHGCINLSPEDARRLFWWTEPQVPAGWHGAARALTGTVVFVHP